MLTLLVPTIINSFYSDINKATFTEDQIRLVILDSGMKVYSHHAPLGSGPGTFGSIMSVNYTKVYEQFNIPERVYLGYGDKSRGPIFDVYVVSLIAEYGFGILLFLLVLLGMLLSKNEEFSFLLFEIKYQKYAFFIFLIMASLTVPILNNSIGLLIFSILGINSKAKRIYE
jgi:hypothetical protein